jgi:hypothetical protein
MKKHIFLMSLLVGLSWNPANAKEEPESELGKQMEAVDDAFKGFRRETDPVKGAAQAREAQNGALKAALEIPQVIKEMPEGSEKVKAIVEYRKMMGKMFVSFCEVEEAFLNGKLDDVAKIVGSLKEQKKAGHEKFVKEEE